MAEHQVLKRMVLLAGAMLGCLCAFVGLMLSVGAVLQHTGIQGIFPVSDGAESIRLPCRVAGTDLIAQQLVMYEGPYLENGSDTPVTDIIGLILYNDGQQEIAQAEVTLTVGEKLTFFASNIMPGMRVLVLESEAKAWREDPITACSGVVNVERQSTLSEQSLKMDILDMGTLSVTNTTQEKLTDIWLFYKNYVPEGELYVGGITYIDTIESLEPGQTVQIKPDRYAAGYSRIIKARIVP